MNYVIALFLGGFFGFFVEQSRIDQVQQNRQSIPLYGYGGFEIHDDGIGRYHDRTLCSLSGLGLVNFPAVPNTYIVGNLVGGPDIQV